MAVQSAPGEQYTIRRKILKILGAGFQIFDAEGNIVGYCNQKAFKLREDLRVYTDESKSTELFHIGTQKILDFGATYQVSLPDETPLGSLRRKGLKSLIRDTWLVFDASGQEIGTLVEDSGSLAILRRVLDNWAFMFPQKFHLDVTGAGRVASYRTHVNPFVYRLGVTVDQEHEAVDDLMVLAAGCLIAAIEGRQK